MEQVREGAIDVDAALARLRHMPFEDLGFAKVDHHRALRQGMPEVIFAMGKTPEQVVAIAGRLQQSRDRTLADRSIDDDAKGALLVVPQHQDHGARKAIRFSAR